MAGWHRRRATGVGLLTSLLALSSCTCGDSVSVVPAGAGAFDLAPGVVDFGRVFIGLSGDSSVELRSSGTASVEWTARFIGSATGFVLVGAEGRLGVGETLPLRVFFVPEVPGTFETVLEFLPDGDETTPRRTVLRGVAVAIPDCEDGNGCTLDSFDFDRGVCVHEAARLPCDDFNGCTMNDLCVEGICLGEGRSCDDGDSCTEDLCDPREGCMHLPRFDCDDNNPCTADLCDPDDGCSHINLRDGTPCDDAEACTTGDICVNGQCIGGIAPETTECDDNDPCSFEERCIDGVCQDPNYIPPGPGDIKYSTEVGPLAPGSEENPLVAPDGTVFVGTEAGVRAIDECGRTAWTATVGTPRFSAAVALPGLLSVPVGGEILDLTQSLGEVTNRVALFDVLPPSSLPDAGPPQVLDGAARTSGALVLSVGRSDGDDGVEGYVVEVDAPHQVATLFSALGPRSARRIVIDQDESVVLLLREGAADRGVAPESIVRLGIEGISGGTWSAGPLEATRSDLGLGAGGEVLWTLGLTRITRRGELTTLVTPTPVVAERIGGSPIVFGPWVWLLERVNGPNGSLTARTSTGGAVLQLPVPNWAPATSPVVDAMGNVFALGSDGVLRAFSANGDTIFSTDLQTTRPPQTAALAMSPQGVVVVALENRVYGIQAFAPLAVSPWPKHRRDNFGTGHR